MDIEAVSLSTGSLKTGLAAGCKTTDFVNTGVHGTFVIFVKL